MENIFDLNSKEKVNRPSESEEKNYKQILLYVNNFNIFNTKKPISFGIYEVEKLILLPVDKEDGREERPIYTRGRDIEIIFKSGNSGIKTEELSSLKLEYGNLEIIKTNKGSFYIAEKTNYRGNGFIIYNKPKIEFGYLFEVDNLREFSLEFGYLFDQMRIQRIDSRRVTENVFVKFGYPVGEIEFKGLKKTKKRNDNNSGAHTNFGRKPKRFKK